MKRFIKILEKLFIRYSLFIALGFAVGLILPIIIREYFIGTDVLLGIAGALIALIIVFFIDKRDAYPVTKLIDREK